MPVTSILTSDSSASRASRDAPPKSVRSEILNPVAAARPQPGGPAAWPRRRRTRRGPGKSS